MNDNNFNQAKSDAFGGRMVNILNQAAIALMLSIGHQVQLFDVMAELPPVTSEQLAAAAQLQERYVREWLGAMVTGQVVSYNPDDTTYTLPSEHAAWLTRAAGINNFAAGFQFIPLMAQVEDVIVDCFRNGGGVPYGAYTRFHQVMAENSDVGKEARLVQEILPLVPGLIEQLEKGVAVADIGCGQGHAINVMARAFPRSHFVGYEISEAAITAGQSEAQAWGLDNAHFALQDATRLHEPERFDFITAFDAIHDQVDPPQVLRNIYQALRPQGYFLMMEFAASSHVHENLDIPIGPFLYTASCLHCMPVSLAHNGLGLGAMWGEQKARELLREAGFQQIEDKMLEGDNVTRFFIAKKLS